MSGYVKNLKLAIPFDGGTVNVELLPMKRGDLFKLQALLPRDPENPNQFLLSGDATEAFELYAKMLQQSYVKQCDLTDADGDPVPAAVWTESAYHSQLVVQVMVQHMDRCQPANPPSPAALPADSSS